MTEEQLQKIQDELMSSLDREDNLEKQIEHMSREISSRLIIDGTAQEEIEERPFIFKFRQYTNGEGKECIFMTVANPYAYQIGLDKYKPFMVNAEIDNDMTMQENLTATVEAFIRHVSGTVKAQELDD